VKEKDREMAKWEKIHEDESRWFRLASTLQYPIELENMRMQLHLYRRL
jgi:25S rRNA (uracil2843-N3)-methyltransferase